MKIVVSGASGNLGSQLIKLVNFNFLAINRDNWTELEKIPESEFDAFIHCAYDLKNSIQLHPTQNINSNIISTANALEVTRNKKIKNFVFISSCAVYGDSSNSSEDKHCVPVTMNGHIKLFNEELVKSFCQTNKMNYLILRVFNTYGGNDQFSVIHKMIDCALTHKKFLLVNDGVSERDFIHIEDVAHIIGMLLNLDLKNEVINIGTGESVKIVDVLTLLQNKLGTIEIEKKSNPNEAVFSRANIKKLNSLINFKAAKIENYIASLR